METTAINTIKEVTSLIETNRPIILEKKQRALLALSAITQVTNDEEDLNANNILVKCNATLPEIDKLRKAYTSKIDDWKKQEMEHEKELKAEMEKVRLLRNSYATRKAEQLKASQQKIDAEKNYKLYEAELKKEMKVAVELGVAEKLSDLESTLAKIFDSAKLEDAKQLEKKLNFNPRLKDEYFIQLFTIDYDESKMSADQFYDLRKRAQNYWTYESINDAYAKTAKEIIAKWIATIPLKIKELEMIEAGGKDAERLKAEAEQRAQKEKLEREAADLESRRAIEAKAEVEAQGESLAIEFQAQVQTQDVGEMEGIRKKRVYNLSPGTAADFMILSRVLGKIVINVLSEKKTSIHKLNTDKTIKTDEHGRPVFVDGVQWWLDKLSDIPYEVKIDGLEVFDKVTTVARAK